MRKPIPQHPGEAQSHQWDKWFNLISNHSVQLEDFDVVLDPVSIAASTTAEQDFTVTGLKSTDIPIALIKPTLTAGIGIGNVRVKTANTLSVTFINPTAGAIDPASETYKLVVIR